MSPGHAERPERDPFAPGVAYLTTPELGQHLDLLHHLIQYSDLLLVVSGVRGAGKTAFIDQLVARAGSHWHTCRIEAGAALDENALLETLCDGFDLRARGEPRAHAELLRSHLEALARSHQIALVVIDDAHLLPESTLDLVAALADGWEGLQAHVVLVQEGPPAPALRRRPEEDFTHQVELPALSVEQTGEYIAARLAAAGFGDDHPFSPAVVSSIHKASGGIPGTVNIFASQVLANHQPPRERARPARGRGIPWWLPVIGAGAITLVVASLYFGREEAPATAAPAGVADRPQPATQQTALASQEPAGAPVTTEPPAGVEAAAAAADAAADAGVSPPPAAADEATAPASEPPPAGPDESIPAAPEPPPSGPDESTRAASEPPPSGADESTAPAPAEPTTTSEAQPAGAAAAVLSGSPAPQPAATETTEEAPAPAPAEVPEQQPPATQLVASGMDTRTADDAGSTSPDATPPASAPAAAPAQPAQTERTNEPASTASAAGPVPSGFAHGPEWVRAQAPERYTVQLMGSFDPAAVSRFAAANRIGARAAWVATQRAGKRWYVVLYGDYPDHDSAHRAIAKLSRALREGGPWPRSFAEVQHLIE